MATDDDFGAFIEKLTIPPIPFSTFPPALQGLSFAIKDIFDVEGHVTGFGNLNWLRTHTAATSTAPAVSTLLEAGATALGITIMDEMAYSINGENAHYGTPVNPIAPDRVPGGSSSGSAVAVAARLVDFGYKENRYWRECTSSSILLWNFRFQAISWSCFYCWSYSYGTELRLSWMVCSEHSHFETCR